MLSKEQKHILFEEGTESPGASPLNYEKREVIIFAQVVVLNCLNLNQNTKVEADGHLFLRHCPMYLKLKLII